MQQIPLTDEEALVLLQSISSDELESFSQDIYDEVANEVSLGLCFEVHRAVKLGFLFLDESKEDEKKFEIVDEIGRDVFGQVPMKKQFECICPNCQRNLAASRFAPHLEKCMGMGRNSSRLASKRIANTGKVDSDIDDLDDGDWNYGNDKKSSKKKRDKNCPRKIKPKARNEERKALLLQCCGVISEHTKKMCTRSRRCPQHTDEQRQIVRLSLLGQQITLPETTDDIQVDIDTYDEGQTQLLQEAMYRSWDTGSSTNASPADSGSAPGGSISSKRKEKRASSNSGRSGGSKKSKSRLPPGGSSINMGNHGALVSQPHLPSDI
ncbi:ataxin-7-like protein 3 isoform X2 [Limulus polyphemus]|uniref:SAGA-associated factor 11 homolog n=1 Tax=Limulus polyphemus TaxID=6850 RepID=A0ABM1S4D6_LIMPO|nr:ataxin-7-like protein 3 isoform X2 [Limulus polyphemus]